MAAYLRRLTRWQAEQQRESVAALHAAAAWHGIAAHHDRQEFLSRFERHVGRGGFDMTAADDAGLIGCAYGYHLGSEDAWWSEAMPQAEELAASGGVFELAELMVLPAHRRHSIATRLVELLLSRHATDLVVTRVERSADGFRELLRTSGWKELPWAVGAAEREVWARDAIR
ncbi:GNAT family N-acetyltransferase [Streptomyces sp. NPDC102360]|uniref:GNAT family N-acetyltransferase n=1 Tax=Streptomyces sp. NPDC102360 TaxID=3366160 RepID=UPI00381A1BE9